MSDEIKPVAWVPLYEVERGRCPSEWSLQDSAGIHDVPLYDQSAIDALRAELATAWAAVESKAGWEWKRRAERAEAESAAKQARIDELMLEYCPDEMTPEQLNEWERHQVSVEKERAR